jgi:hypothetical protein
MKQTGLLAAVLVLLVCGAAGAEDRFGVPVYPGAKYDAATSKALKDSMGFNGECFQTNDSVQKVAEFYRSKGLKSFGDTTKEGALFRKRNVDVTVQSPWMNMKTGAMMKNTLISIVKQSE